MWMKNGLNGNLASGSCVRVADYTAKSFLIDWAIWLQLRSMEGSSR
jgi:hypothetical protein